MRRVKIIQVEGRGEVTVKEVSGKALYNAWGAEDRLTELKALFADAVQPGFEEISAWYPSEIDQVVAAWMEVNDSFFSIAARLKVDGVLRQLLDTVASGLAAAFASSYDAATSTPGTTAGQ